MILHSNSAANKRLTLSDRKQISSSPEHQAIILKSLKTSKGRMMRPSSQLVTLIDLYGHHSQRIFHNNNFFRFHRRNEKVRYSHNIGSTDQKLKQQDDRYVNLQCAPVNFDKNSVLVFPEIISESESIVLLKDIDVRVASKRYQRGHWDAVITGYRELELPNPDDSNLIGDIEGKSYSSQRTLDFISIESQLVIRSIRQCLVDLCFSDQTTNKLVTWLPCHVIDLKSEGKLMAHVDSIRFSGHIVAGLCLGSSAIMRLRPSANYDSSQGYDNNTNNHQQPSDRHYVDMYLPPRTLYVLRGAARYEYSHELLPDSSTFYFLDHDDARQNAIVVRRDRRISVMFRDAKLKE